MTYTIEQVTTLIGAHRYGCVETTIAFLLTDSRSVCFPEETLFFAIKTDRNDGHRYISELYKKGVKNFVVTTLPQNYDSLYPTANFLKVTSSLKALQRLAERHRDSFSIPVIGITGSNGKTMVKEWIYQLLSPSMVITRSPKSYNSQTGVPLSVWLMNENTQLALIEAGISEPQEMNALKTIIQPTIGVFTTLSDAHQEHFSSLKSKCIEKLELFHEVKTLIYNVDEVILQEAIADMHFSGELFTISTKQKEATFYVSNIKKEDKMSVIEYQYKGQTYCYSLPFIDDASIQNSITCAAVALYLGIDSTTLAERMTYLEPVAMRLEVKEGINGCTLINDAYNADLNSLDIALDFMNRRPNHKGYAHTLILSDIYETGKPLKQLYTEVSNLLINRNIDKLIGIGENITAFQDLIKVDNKVFFTSVKDFITSDLWKNFKDEIVLLKGARKFGFEQITELLVQKVHETTLEVNLTAMIENLNFYRSYMKKDTKLVCMIKADGYGAGAIEIAKTLQDHRVDYLAVAVADEGVLLRKSGITANIMVMNPEMSSFKTLFDFDLEPEVYSFRLLDALIEAANKEGVTQFPIHLKLDTGMHRLGFNPLEDMDLLIERLKHQNNLIPKSVFSHFVGADNEKFNTFSEQQFSLFTQASNQLQDAFSHHILKHIDNSAGILNFPARQLDMCRLGLGLYGIDSRNNNILSNVCSLYTTILQLHKVPKDETVGYSRKGTLNKDSVIASIPIGYADGLNRHLGNRHCYCLVNEKKAEYVGNICMDVAIIDVTDIDCKEGDRVEIFGNNLPVTVLSDALNTIPYEVLTTISQRVKRIYFQD